MENFDTNTKRSNKTKNLAEIQSKLESAYQKGIITKFQHQVYQKLMEVPKGRVTTYADLASAISCGSSQAIGQALKKNPFAPQVPCHRVVRTDLTVGGFSSSTSDESVSKKINLLKSEGVEFDEVCHGKDVGLEKSTKVKSNYQMHL